MPVERRLGRDSQGVGMWNEITERFGESIELVMARIAKSRFSAQNRIEFYRTLVLLYRNNSSVLDGLQDIAANYSEDGKKRFNPIAMVARDCAQSVENGEKLSVQLQYWAPEQEVQLIAAGELAGSLAEGLRRGVEAVQQSENIRKALSHLLYPLLLLGGIGYLLNQVSTTIVPQMVKMGSPETWTAEGRILKSIAEIVTTLGHTGAIVGAATILAIVVTFPYFVGPIRVFFDRWPPWSFYRDIKGSDFLLQVTMLQNSNTSLELALEQVRDMASPWMQERIEAVSLGVANGLNFGDALDRTGYGFPNPAAIRYLRTIAGKDGSKRNIEQFARDWNTATLERIDRYVNRTVSVGIFVFYGIVYLIWAGMNGVMDSMLGAMPGM